MIKLKITSFKEDSRLPKVIPDKKLLRLKTQSKTNISIDFYSISLI